MSFSHDRRGQSVVVGTVILFGFLILAMATYQVQFVPTENQEIEFEHSQQVEGDFLDLRNAILQAGSTGSAQSKRVRLGTRYPQRTFFLNPPPASGSLQTTESREIRIENVSVEDDGNAEAYWENNDLTFNTSSLQYRPNYNEYRGAPRLTYEHSAIAGEFDNGAVLLRSDPTVVRGESGTDPRISLTVLTGDISDNGVDARNVDVSPVSQGRGSVRLAPDSGDSRIVLPTAVENETALAERWNRTTDATVTVHGEGRIQVALDGNYSLSLSEVSIDGGGATEPAYLVPVTGNGTVGQSVGVEVRDTYNNPVADAEVSFNGTTGVDGMTGNTTEDGRVFFEPDAPGEYNATINGTGGQQYEKVPFSVIEPANSTQANRTFDIAWDDDDDEVQLPEGNNTLTGLSVEDANSREGIADAEIATSFSSNTTRSITVSNNTTDRAGTATIDIGAGDAQAGDVFYVYASSGDDVATVPVTITERDSVLEPGTVSSSDRQLIFTMQNVGDTDVTIEKFAVDATGINTGITINDGNAAELEIREGTVEGRADRNGNPDSFDANGTEYDLEADSQGNQGQGKQGQYATISPDDGDVTVDFRQFSERLDNGGTNELEFTDSATDADVIVTFVLSDGSKEKLYLQQS